MMRGYDVYIGGRFVDRVFYVSNSPAKDVRRDLIEHDGLPATISVYRQAVGRPAYDDVARASHPEECK